MHLEPEQIGIRILGPMYAHLGSQPIAPSAAKQRQILALLALNPGRVVTVSTLIEELWGDNPPRSSATTLQTYILQLRNRLKAAGPRAGRQVRQILSTCHTGYLLEGTSCQTDVAEFSRLARLGRAAAEADDHHTASEMLSQALQLWRGPALVDVPMGRVLEPEATSLEETRRGVLERRIEADLALDRHADMLGELMLLTARNPMNENLCAFLMTALYRSGDTARALEEFRRLRAVLTDELGVEPCPRLHRLQQAMLARDPALDPADRLVRL